MEKKKKTHTQKNEEQVIRRENKHYFSWFIYIYFEYAYKVASLSRRGATS